MRDSFVFSLNKLKEYQQELQIYQDKYNIVELLKKYSSQPKEEFKLYLCNYIWIKLLV